MNNLEMAHLVRYCKKYGIDYQEIDSTLTYYENKQHLRSIVRMIDQSLDAFEIERMAELQRQYMKEDPISYYLACQMVGETVSSETGAPVDHEVSFSLSDYVESVGIRNGGHD
jgi:hypothetical protein